MVAHITEIDETIDALEQMIRRDMVFYRELVEQRALRNLPRPHHRQFSHASGEVNRQPSHHSSGVFQHHLRTADLTIPPGFATDQPSFSELHRLRDGERIFELDTEIAQGAKNTHFRKATT